MNVCFIKASKLGSAIMRGDQVSECLNELGYKTESVFADSERAQSIRDALVVVVKSATPEFIQDLRERNNAVIYDCVDKFTRKDWPDEVMGLTFANGFITCSEYARAYFSPLFAGKPVAVIPHHWDPKLLLSVELYKKTPKFLRIGYLGEPAYHAFKEIIDVVPLYHPGQYMAMAGFFTCHYSVRPDDPEGRFKPATKASTAAAVGANIITTRDPALTELIGQEYPYYVDEFSQACVKDVILRLMRDFQKNEDWYTGLAMMRELADKTEIGRCADMYLSLFEQFGLKRLKEENNVVELKRA